MGTWLLAMVAFCEGCDWRLDARNALGVAARHHDRTGHRVRVEITRVVVYGEKETSPTSLGRG